MLDVSSAPAGGQVTVADGGGCRPFSEPTTVLVNLMPLNIALPEMVALTTADANGRWGPVDVTIPGDISAGQYVITADCFSDHSAVQYDRFAPVITVMP